MLAVSRVAQRLPSADAVKQQSLEICLEVSPSVGQYRILAGTIHASLASSASWELWFSSYLQQQTVPPCRISSAS